MARGRRKSNGTWFPMLGTTRGAEEERHVFNLRTQVLTIAGTPQPVVGVIPLTLDEPQDSSDQSEDTKGIGEFIGNEYIIKRVLGQCFVGRSISTDATNGYEDTPTVYATAGFFVARANDGSDAITDSFPIGFTATGAVKNYSPQMTQNIREPWMWRRSWLLGRGGTQGQANQFVMPTTFEAGAWYPHTNVDYNNMSDHRVDIKSRRRVRLDERLWFCAGAMSLDGNTTEATTEVRFTADLRIFGQLRKPVNQGSF